MTPGAAVASLVLLLVVVHPSQPVCVDVDSETDAVLGNPMKLMCISCLKREEITSRTEVEWSYEPPGQDPRIIYRYNERPLAVEGPWIDRLQWKGSKDLQDVSILIKNVTLNDTGTYKCVVSRQFMFDSYKPLFNHSKFFSGEQVVFRNRLGSASVLLNHMPWRTAQLCTRRS